MPGALEKEIEADIGVSKADFQALNSVYFAPNLIMPLLVGLLSQRMGASIVLIGLCLLFLCGNILIASGAQGRDYNLFLYGRVVTGLCYESIDVIPLPILAPLFEDQWGFMAGLFNGFLRCGSVANFLLSPQMYHVGGLAAASWMCTAFAMSGCVAALLSKPLSRKALLAVQGGAQSRLITAESNDAEANSGASGPTLLPPSPPGIGDFLFFVVVGTCMYAAVVPFWFYGGGFIRNKWGYSLDAADAMVLLCEGGIAVVAPFLGGLVDRLTTLPRKLSALAASSLLLPAGFLFVALAPRSVPPVFPMLFLGLGIAAVNSVYWCISAQIIPPRHQALCSGLLGSAVNLGATVVPLLMARVATDVAALMLLVAASALTTMTAISLLW
eukprot:CAMPEP_0178371668 /NCGR_PEP_ID=MMETSP0689_2-20121128/946_1 /TAXON_ID=160604 /ORGANISM="Amphidinium massartii, Strain CS-259" /LENGTH=384 /DNA_ID=CAMNT_0019991547 /DNA_START=124 /DNA_END=1275 /DNA_ORIENTATION=+